MSEEGTQNKEYIKFIKDCLTTKKSQTSIIVDSNSDSEYNFFEDFQVNIYKYLEDENLEKNLKNTVKAEEIHDMLRNTIENLPSQIITRSKTKQLHTENSCDGDSMFMRHIHLRPRSSYHQHSIPSSGQARYLQPHPTGPPQPNPQAQPPAMGNMFAQCLQDKLFFQSFPPDSIQLLIQQFELYIQLLMHIFLSSSNEKIFSKAGYFLDQLIMLKLQIDKQQHEISFAKKYEIPFIKIKDKPIQVHKQISIFQSPSLLLGLPLYESKVEKEKNQGDYEHVSNFFRQNAPLTYPILGNLPIKTKREDFTQKNKKFDFIDDYLLLIAVKQFGIADTLQIQEYYLPRKIEAEIINRLKNLISPAKSYVTPGYITQALQYEGKTTLLPGSTIGKILQGFNWVGSERKTDKINGRKGRWGVLSRYCLNGEISAWKLEKEYYARHQLFRIKVCDPESLEFPVISCINDPNWVDIDQKLVEEQKNAEQLQAVDVEAEDQLPLQYKLEDIQYYELRDQSESQSESEEEEIEIEEEQQEKKQEEDQS